MPTTNKLFALVDCNNFYASCERLFRPDLEGKPIVVLSNNDGCVIARSNEAKALGIPMGAPLFKVRALLDRHRVEVFSSNFALYGDLSYRVMELLRQNEYHVEVYSIDEAFLSLPVAGGWDRLGYLLGLRAQILKEVGIPVSIGVARTKTLAKVANRIAKKNPHYRGVFDLEAAEGQLDSILAGVEVADIWGIGRRSTEKLNLRGIVTALDLKQADEKLVRKLLTVTGARTRLELHGIPCIPLELSPPSPKSMVTSRSFGRPVADFEQLREAVISYTSMVAEKLRRQGLEADCLHLFITTGPFARDSSYSASQTVTLPQPTASTAQLIAAALRVLKAIYRQGPRYRKAGVMLTGLIKPGYRPVDLFAPPQPARDDRKLMAALDTINGKWGRQTIQYGMTAEADKPWGMQQGRRSPAYTSKWEDVAVVKAE